MYWFGHVINMSDFQVSNQLLFQRLYSSIICLEKYKKFQSLFTSPAGITRNHRVRSWITQGSRCLPTPTKCYLSLGKKLDITREDHLTWRHESFECVSFHLKKGTKRTFSWLPKSIFNMWTHRFELWPWIFTNLMAFDSLANHALRP